uniref:sugar transporter n=1 Tax=Prevotellamassilia timonensis TaxID=1852370 RepID=UPI004038B0A4
MQDKMSLANWLSLLGLTFATFIFNTSEFVPIGLLTDIKTDFHLTEATVGMLISVYAWAVMILSLPLMLLVSKMEMKRLMLWLVGLFAVFQFMSFLSSSYAMLMLSRIGVACTHAVFWSVISPIAVRIVPDKYRSIALSMVVTGSSVAMILGMPLGRIIGLHVGWRITFLSIGIFAALTLVYMAFRLPRVPSRGGFSPRKLPALLRQKGVVGLYIFTLLISTSYYVGYSYIEPFMKQVAGMRDSLVTTTLMIYGGAGFLGSIAFSRYYNRNRKRFISVIVAIMSVCLLLLTPISGSWVTLIAVCALWGLAATAYNVAMQSNIILITTPESTSVAMSIFSGIFNLGIGSGAFFGGIICSQASIAYIGYAGALLGLTGLAYWVCRLGSRV